MFFLDVVQNWIIFLNIFDIPDILWRIVSWMDEFCWLELWIKSIEHRIKGKEMLFCPLKIFKKSSKSSCCLKVSKLLGIVFVPKSCVSNLGFCVSRNVSETSWNLKHLRLSLNLLSLSLWQLRKDRQRMRWMWKNIHRSASNFFTATWSGGFVKVFVLSKSSSPLRSGRKRPRWLIRIW